MSALSPRDPTPAEAAFIADVLRRLREHYHTWCAPETEGHEYDLVAFAYYEGCDRRDECCRGILSEAAPFALGQELVLRHGFRWVMLPSGDTWRYGVAHPTLEHPIDLLSLEDGSWNDEEYDPGSEPHPGDGSMTHDSLETILKRIGADAAEAT
jgi:hypothetical protein